MQPAPGDPETSPTAGDGHEKGGTEAQGNAPSGADEAMTAMEQELQAIRATLALAQHERDAALVAAQQAATEAETKVAAATAELADSRAATLAAQRAQILAEKAGAIIPELVQGSTLEELQASVSVAEAAFTRALDAARAQMASGVPAGATVNTPPDTESLTAFERIKNGLTRGGRG